jgi:ApaG protein
MSSSSIAITDGIKVTTSSYYVPERSNPGHGMYFFAYDIEIENVGDSSAQLLRRHWLIKDSLGNVQEVDGDGVVGEQPHLEPGERFDYTSFCPLPTYKGSMEGTYVFRRDDASEFDVHINPFELFNKTVLN